MLKHKITYAITALMLTATPFASAKTLANYQEVLAEMKTGKTVFALVDYSKCQVKQKGNSYDLEVRTIGIRMDHLFDLVETRFDGKRMNVVGYDQHSYGGGQSGYTLSRQLIHLWEDNSIDVIDDLVDPLTYKLKDREWMICKASKDGSGGVTFTSN